MFLLCEKLRGEIKSKREEGHRETGRTCSNGKEKGKGGKNRRGNGSKAFVNGEGKGIERKKMGKKNQDV